MARQIFSFPFLVSSALFVLVAVSLCSQKASAAPLLKCPAGEQYLRMTITGCDTCLADIRKRQPSGSSISNYACNSVDGGRILCEACFKFPPPPPPPSPPPPPPPTPGCLPSDEHISLITTGCDVCLSELVKNKPSGTYLVTYSCTGIVGSSTCKGCYRTLDSPPPPASSCTCLKEMIVQDPTEPGKEACRNILAPKLAMVAN